MQLEGVSEFFEPLRLKVDSQLVIVLFGARGEKRKKAKKTNKMGETKKARRLATKQNGHRCTRF